jgi:predicted peptidase
VLLAWLSETAAEAPPAVVRTGPWARDQKWWYGLRKELGMVNTRFLIDLPAGYADDPAKRWPLVLFLHGAGERGDDLSKVRIHGPPKRAAAGQAFPFILVSPQCPNGTWWSVPELADPLDRVQAEYRVDPDRVTCTGLSMGGFGTWALACEFPGRFAAIAPVCGGGDPRDVQRLLGIPAWVFHGGKDGVVPVTCSVDMVAALRALGAKPGLTVYPEAGHDSWTATYDNPAFYDWLLANRRGQPVWPTPAAPP